MKKSIVLKNKSIYFFKPQFMRNIIIVIVQLEFFYILLKISILCLVIAHFNYTYNGLYQLNY